MAIDGKISSVALAVSVHLETENPDVSSHCACLWLTQYAGPLSPGKYSRLSPCLRQFSCSVFPGLHILSWHSRIYREGVMVEWNLILWKWVGVAIFWAPVVRQRELAASVRGAHLCHRYFYNCIPIPMEKPFAFTCSTVSDVCKVNSNCITFCAIRTAWSLAHWRATANPLRDLLIWETFIKAVFLFTCSRPSDPEGDPKHRYDPQIISHVCFTGNAIFNASAFRHTIANNAAN